LAVNLEIHQRFKSTDRLQTEHGQLEDNSDGIGKELQVDFLPVDALEGEEGIEATVESDAKPRSNRIRTANSDGDLARQIVINKPASIPPTESTPTEPAPTEPAPTEPTPTEAEPTAKDTEPTAAETEPTSTQP
jgi:hypothetical protein